MSGWSNYPCTVTMHKIDENQMGNRGSKSVSYLTPIKDTVKEQRVDGSWCILKYTKMHLRCTLMGFERNYRINNPSKQLVRNFSFLHSSSCKLNPWYITGFSDAESSFSVSIDRLIKRNLGWRVQAKYQICLHERDLSLLLKIQQFFNGVGSIVKKVLWFTIQCLV